MHAPLPIGFSEFAQLRREGLLYVDKTALVADVVRSTRQVVLLPRPRRFGKTLNLTMLRAFFEHPPDSPLFAGLAVASAGAAPVWRWAAVFDGKRVWAEREP